MSPIEIEPEQREITLWSWRPGSGRPPPLLLIGGLLLFVGSLFLLLMGNYAYKEHRLSSEGKLTDGIVVKKVLNQASDNGTSKTSYAVDYTFTTADGRKIAGHDTVDPDIWDQLKEGGPVQIEYAPSKPRINQVGATGGAIIGGYTVLIVASAMWLLGATLAVKGLLGSSAPAAGVAAESNMVTVAKSGNFCLVFVESSVVGERRSWSWSRCSRRCPCIRTRRSRPVLRKCTLSLP